MTNEIKKPHWTSSVHTHRTQKGWRVDIYHNTHGNLSGPKRFRVYTPDLTEQQAIHWASHSKQGQRCRTMSRGEWVLSEVKKRYTKEQRQDLFRQWNKYLKAEFGDLRSSIECQDEIIRVLKLPKSYAATAFELARS